MKKTIIIITLGLMTWSLSAQDKIYFLDGSSVEAKVSVVSESKISYKNFDNQSGPTFEVGLSKINMIVYENGSHQIFKEEADEATISKTFRGFKNRINLDLLAIGNNGPTSISYEKINEDGSRGIEIPISVYFNLDGVAGYTIGYNIKYYVSKQGKGFYIGPSIGLGQFTYLYRDYYYEDFYAVDEFATFLGLKLGSQFQISDVFGINLAGNLGAISNFDQVDLGYSLNLGINFSF